MWWRMIQIEMKLLWKNLLKQFKNLIRSLLMYFFNLRWVNFLCRNFIMIVLFERIWWKWKSYNFNNKLQLSSFISIAWVNFFFLNNFNKKYTSTCSQSFSLNCSKFNFYKNPILLESSIFSLIFLLWIYNYRFFCLTVFELKEIRINLWKWYKTSLKRRFLRRKFILNMP